MGHVRKLRLAAPLIGLALVAAACGSSGDPTVSPEASPATTDDQPTTETTTEPTGSAAVSAPCARDVDLQAIDLNAPTRGPNGEAATPASDVELTDDETGQISEQDHTAALLWAGSGEWYEALTAGSTAMFDDVGVEVTTTTDAEFDPAKQASQVETAMATNPSMMLTLVVDPVSGAQAFQPAVEATTELVFADNGAQDYEAGNEYTGIVTGDHFAMGTAAADLMAEALGDDGGTVGYICHDAQFYVTNNRDTYFRAAVAQNHPTIEIADVQGFTEEAATFDVANAMVSQNPDLEGIYVSWAVAAQGVVEALRAAGRDDVKVVTYDFDATTALDMAQNGNVYGVVADTPYTIGQTMAEMGGYGLLDKQAPPFVTVDVVTATRNNLAEAWRESLHKDPPQEVLDALN